MRFFDRRRQRADDAVLGVLRDGPATGGEVCTRSGLRMGRAWPALGRLEHSGRITAVRLPDGRRLYRIVGVDA